MDLKKNEVKINLTRRSGTVFPNPSEWSYSPSRASKSYFGDPDFSKLLDWLQIFGGLQWPKGQSHAQKNTSQRTGTMAEE
jgi:hypothetical protein